MTTSANRHCFRMELFFTLLASLVLLNGVNLEEAPSRQRRGSWEDTPLETEDDQFFDVDRIPRQDPQAVTESTPDPTITDPTAVSTDLPESTLPPSPPPDNCGTSFVSSIGVNDPGPCFKDTSPISCPDTDEICMKDFSNPDLYSCLWRTASATKGVDPDTTEIVVDVPGHCEPNNPPTEFTNSTIAFNYHCRPSKSPPVLQLTKCVCTKWDGSCPEEEKLKTCELEVLKILAEEMITKIAESSELVQQDCECDYELEKKLPMAMEALKAGKNLYRVVMLLLDARNKHICNRRRLMACLPDGRCGCAPGTARREKEVSGVKYQSYFCYPIQGACDKDPAEVIPQFDLMQIKEKIWSHYGHPERIFHHNANNGCFYNLCKNADDVRRKTCEDVNA